MKQTKPLPKGRSSEAARGGSPLVIGIAGASGSGKDVAATILVEELGFVRLAFADPLKRVCELAALRFLDKADLRVRRLYQEVGMAFRDFDEEIWIDNLRDRMRHHSLSRRFVIPDCRFIDELDFARAFGFAWRIDRPGAGLADPELAAHTSEQEWRTWPNWSAVIENEGTLSDLRSDVLAAADEAIKIIEGPKCRKAANSI